MINDVSFFINISVLRPELAVIFLLGTENETFLIPGVPGMFALPSKNPPPPPPPPLFVFFLPPAPPAPIHKKYIVILDDQFVRVAFVVNVELLDKSLPSIKKTR